MRRDRLQASLRRRLRGRYSDGLWAYLDEKGYVEDASGSPDGIELLEREARGILAVGSSQTTEAIEVAEPAGPTSGQERAWALSQLVADIASRDPDIMSFRSRYLQGGLIDWSMLADWIKSESDADGEGTVKLTVTVPKSMVRRDGRKLLLDPALTAVVGPYSLAVDDLPYALRGDRWMRRVAVAGGGVLDRLQVLAKAVAEGYAWDEAQATVFILCGVTPLVEPVRASSPVFKVRHNIDHGWSRRIMLDVDPAATPKQVVTAFLTARRQSGIRQLRPLSAKHARLAAFTGATHSDHSWAVRLRLWNEELPHWRYEAPTNFRRDAIRAQARILYPGRHPGQTPIRTRTSTASGDI